MRKAFLALMLGLVLATSGCMGGGETQGDNPKNSSRVAGEPNISVISVSAPEEVALGDDVKFDVRVKNSGGSEGRFYSSVRVSRKKFDYENPSSTGKELSGSIGPGQDKVLSWNFRASTIGTFKFSLSNHEGSSIVKIAPRNLSIGESYNNTRGISMTVEDLEFKESYRITKDDGTSGDKDIRSGKIAFVKYRTKNLGTSAEVPTSGHNIYLWAGDNRYEETSHVEEAENYESYEASSLQPDESRTGYLSFKIPSGISRSDLKVTWNEDIGQSQKKINWKP